MVTSQLPEEQPTATVLVLGTTAHAFVQVPQLLISVKTSVSQPVAKVASQSEKPMAQVTTLHSPAAHPTVATLVLAIGTHVAPQEPQLVALVLMLISQPLVKELSQFCNPAAQGVLKHKLLLHPIAAVVFTLAALHTVAHLPQWVLLVDKFTSQPLGFLASQLANGALQEATVQTPDTHLGVAFARLHTFPAQVTAET